jgi:CheY-like chemotaxis protein
LELNQIAARVLTCFTARTEEAPMEQARQLRARALVVEDDPIQREMIGLLLEESDFDVIECASAEAAEVVLQRDGEDLDLMMTDVELAGYKDGVELAHIAKRCNPALGVIVTSGKPLRRQLPDGAKFWSKPWVPLDVIREAERMALARDSRH